MDDSTRTGIEPSGIPCWKVGYGTRKDANKAMRAVLRKHGSDKRPMSVYKCPHCTDWHYGHHGRRNQLPKG